MQRQCFLEAFQAAIDGDTVKILSFIEQNKHSIPLLNACTEEGKTVLHLAAENDNRTIVSALIREKTCIINLQDYQGNTALMLAAKSGHFSAVSRLLDSGNIDVGLKNHNGYMAIQITNNPLIRSLLRDYKNNATYPPIAPCIKAEKEPKVVAKPESELPPEFFDPISYEIFKDPITLSNGQTFERKGLIAHWEKTGMKDYFLCPLTNKEIKKEELKFQTNYGLVSLIERKIKKREVKALQQNSLFKKVEKPESNAEPALKRNP